MTLPRILHLRLQLDTQPPGANRQDSIILLNILLDRFLRGPTSPRIYFPEPHDSDSIRP